MYLNTLRFVAFAASSLFGIVSANPHFRISARDLYVGQQCTDFNYGAKKVSIGQVCANIADGNLIINYSGPGITFKEVHVYVGTEIPSTTVPKTAPGGFPYKDGDGKCSITGVGTAQCKIPIDNAWRTCSGKLYLATHASVTGSSIGDQTAWGSTDCWPTDKETGNCNKYWSIDRTCYCKSTSFPAPVTMTSTSTTTYTSTSTTEYLTSTTSTYTTSTVVQFSTTDYSTTTITAESTTTSTSTPAPVVTTATCLAAY